MLGSCPVMSIQQQCFWFWFGIDDSICGAWFAQALSNMTSHSIDSMLVLNPQKAMLSNNRKRPQVSTLFVSRPVAAAVCESCFPYCTVCSAHCTVWSPNIPRFPSHAIFPSHSVQHFQAGRAGLRSAKASPSQAGLKTKSRPIRKLSAATSCESPARSARLRREKVRAEPLREKKALDCETFPPTSHLTTTRPWTSSGDAQLHRQLYWPFFAGN